jgi:type I restriction enzyme S subunit
VIYHYHIWKIIEDPKVVCKKWLYWWLYWDAASIKRIHGTGTTMTHITKGAMESRNMLLPGLEHQVEITNGIDALAAEIEILRNGFVKQQDLYNSLRQAILSEIFRQEANVS